MPNGWAIFITCHIIFALIALGLAHASKPQIKPLKINPMVRTILVDGKTDYRVFPVKS